MVFRFDDGSVFDETVTFSQQRVFTMQTYHLSQRGRAFAEDTDISLARETVHIVSFTPEPRIMELDVAPSGRAQDAGRPTHEGRDPLHVPSEPRRLARALRDAVRAIAGGRSRLDRHRGRAGLRAVRGAARSCGAGLAIELTSPRWPD
ncbi:MAG TPA: hypothetical protein VKV24_15510 [Casimicrobiaceae bacterium]|nr:hypothetical protein [Casimicrobiaceae bacterium]